MDTESPRDLDPAGDLGPRQQGYRNPLAGPVVEVVELDRQRAEEDASVAATLDQAQAGSELPAWSDR